MHSSTLSQDGQTVVQMSEDGSELSGRHIARMDVMCRVSAPQPNAFSGIVAVACGATTSIVAAHRDSGSVSVYALIGGMTSETGAVGVEAGDNVGERDSTEQTGSRNRGRTQLQLRHLITQQIMQYQPIISMSVSATSLTLLFGDGSFAFISINSLFQAMQASLTSIPFAIHSAPLPHKRAQAVLSLGPSHRWHPALINAHNSLNAPTDSIPHPPPVSMRFASIGSDPPLTLLAASDKSSHSPFEKTGPRVGALSATGGQDHSVVSVDKIASVVVEGLFSFTKSMFASSPATSPTNPSSFDERSPSIHHAKAMPALSVFLKFEDFGMAPSLSLSPTTPSSKSRKFISASVCPFREVLALLDSWGRVVLFDYAACEVLAIIKGVRDSQIAWMRAETEGNDPRSKSSCWHLVLLLGRGVLEIYRWDGYVGVGRRSRSSPSNETKSDRGWESSNTENVLTRVLARAVGTGWMLLQSCGGVTLSETGQCAEDPGKGVVAMLHRTTNQVRLVSGFLSASDAAKGENSLSNGGTSSLRPRETLARVVAACQSLSLEDESFTADDLSNLILDLKDVRVQTAVALFTFSIAIQIALAYVPFSTARKLIQTVYESRTRDLPFNLEKQNMAVPREVDGQYPIQLSRPFHTALVDLWMLQRVARLFEDVLHNSTDRVASSQVAPTYLSDIQTCIQDLLADERWVISGDSNSELPGTEFARFVTVVEARYTSKHEGRLLICLKSGLDSQNTAVQNAANLLFATLLTRDGDDGLNTNAPQRNPFCDFQSLDICLLFVKAVETAFGQRHVDVGCLLRNMERFIQLMLDSEDPEVNDFFMQCCWNSSHIPTAYALSHILYQTMSSKASFRHIEMEPLLCKLKDCVFLQRHITSNLPILKTMSAKTLNASERTSIPRIIALFECSLTETIPTEQQRISLKTLYSHFGTTCSNVIPIYKTRIHADAWLANPSCTQDESLLHRCVSSILQIRHPILRNATSIFLFHHVWSMKLRTLIDMVDRARKAPKSAACVHNLGPGMDVDVVLGAFLEVGMRLLTDCLIVEEGVGSVEDMVGDVIEAVGGVAGGVVDVGVAGGYADDVFGAILGRLRNAGGNGRGVDAEGFELSTRLVKEHLRMFRVLKAIFTHDLKMVRPSRLFSGKVAFGKTLFESGGDVRSEDVLEEEVLKERALFQAKLSDPELAKSLFL
ncbi:hypothetical protein HDU77_000652 [Chytriomyces hyalinus]|nr:hypothetical protein HDU77_000652 [Chytriomyces hyalinus]